MSAFDSLIGKKIDNVYLDQNEDELAFRVGEELFTYRTVPSCCNHVWFSHFNWVDNLIGAQVIAVEYKDGGDLHHTSKLQGDDVLEHWFYTFKTDKGYADLEVRNNHNGFYGGEVKEFDCTEFWESDTALFVKESLDTMFLEVKEDF